VKLEEPSDLETQVANRKRELIAEIIEHKKNSSRYGAAESIQRLKDKLVELSHIVKEVDRWTSISPQAKLRLAEWVAR
jgi:hypothetical protein